MKYYCIVLVLLLISCSSENQKIEGQISDDEGKALNDVLVQVMGTDLYTYSDDEGYFAINTKSRGTELIFNKEGFNLGRETIQKDEVMQVKLIPISIENKAQKDSIPVVE